MTLHHDQPRAIRKLEARKLMERETHHLVLRVTDGGVPEFMADWWYDLRRKQLRIYGGLLRFIDMSILRRVPKAVLKLIPQWIDAYIEEQFADDPQPPPTAAKAA